VRRNHRRVKKGFSCLEKFPHDIVREIRNRALSLRNFSDFCSFLVSVLALGASSFPPVGSPL
jgi:hypothetical protein